MAFEFQFLDFLQTLHSPVMDFLMTTVTKFGDAGIFWCVLTLVLMINKKTRKLGFITFIAIVIDYILCNLLIKNIVARTRPYNINTAVELLIKKPSEYSFPSGHTAISFTCAFSYFFAKYKKAAFAAFVLATLVAFSRMYLYVHYPTDILGGIVIGVISGYCGNKIYNMIQEKHAQKTAMQNQND